MGYAALADTLTTDTMTDDGDPLPLPNVPPEKRREVEAIRRASAHDLSSHAFVSLALWQKEMGLSLLLADGMFTVKSQFFGEEAWFFPCGNDRATCDFIASLPQDARLYYLRAKDVVWLARSFPGAFRFARQPDTDEYLYSIPEHIALAGSAYANMRTQVHRVENAYRVRVEPLDEHTQDDALTIVTQWSRGHDRFGDCALRDDDVDAAAVRHWRALGLEGVVVYLDDVPMAVTAGFALSRHVFDIAIAKCAQNLQGLSYYAKRALMERVSDRFSLMNLEEDLGIEGLRRMKRSLRPVHMHELWEATRL